MYTVIIHNIFARYLNSFDTSCVVKMGRQNTIWMVWGVKRLGSFWCQSMRCLIIAFNQPWVPVLTATAHGATHLESGPACKASIQFCKTKTLRKFASSKQRNTQPRVKDHKYFIPPKSNKYLSVRSCQLSYLTF